MCFIYDKKRDMLGRKGKIEKTRTIQKKKDIGIGEEFQFCARIIFQNNTISQGPSNRGIKKAFVLGTEAMVAHTVVVKGVRH